MDKNQLSSLEIEQKLQGLDNWVLEAISKSICKEWEFESFKTAMRFIVSVGDIAEKLNHHPEFLSVYTKVQIRLTTHDSSGLTNKDFNLATEIDQLVERDFRNVAKNR